MLPKLCYILPEYRPDDATHFSHIHDFLKEISGFFDIYLVVEKGLKPPISLGYKKAYALKSRFVLFRTIEMKIVLLKVRLDGYKDFYIHYSFLAAFIASFIARFSGGRVFYWNCGEPWKYKRGFFREMFERMVYRLIDFQVTGSSSIADQYSKYYLIPRAKIKIMPNWIDLKRFNTKEDKVEIRKRFKLPVDKKIILFIHRLSPRKGSRMIIPVAGAVIGRNKDAYFVIVGEGPDENYLREAIKQSALDDNILVVGTVPNKDIPNYLKSADVFFMPSEEEGFPRVLLESMAMGVPYVASDVGAVKEITPSMLKSYIIKPGDTGTFVGKITELTAKNQEEQKIISVELMAEATKYNVVIVANRFRELLTA